MIANSFYRDRWTALAQVVLCGIGFVTTLISVDHIPGRRRGADPSRRDDHIAEFFALLLAATAGMTFIVGAANLMGLFLSLEWFSIALYIMCAIDYDLEGSLEAGLKYLIIGSFGSASLLFGSALVYGATNQIGFVEIARAGGEARVVARRAARPRTGDDHLRASPSRRPPRRSTCGRRTSTRARRRR